tara:strand:- start:116 stop:316 length:201 start_codon:yes stop_codon:yes gene_type:complete
MKLQICVFIIFFINNFMLFSDVRQLFPNLRFKNADRGKIAPEGPIWRIADLRSRPVEFLFVLAVCL